MLDSGCTNHMTGEKDMFTSFQPSHDQSGNIVFGDNGKGEVLGLGKIAISNDPSISNVFLIGSLNLNLLLVAQLCDLEFKRKIEKKMCYRIRSDAPIQYFPHA